MSALPPCPQCASTLTYHDGLALVCPECGHEWKESAAVASSDETAVIRDAFGTPLADGDSVTVIKDLKVKGSGGVTLKRGTLVKNIRLTGDPDEIEANVEKVRGLVLRTEFVKKA